MWSGVVASHALLASHIFAVNLPPVQLFQDPLVSELVKEVETLPAVTMARRALTSNSRRMVVELLAERVARHFETKVTHPHRVFNEEGALLLQSQVLV